jgi:lipoyl(octanoyl) transferase
LNKKAWEGDLFSESTLEKFDLTSKNITTDGRNTWVRKWNWDYRKAHQFQRFCVELLINHPQSRILILCNHPHVLTNGRGLQKPRKGETLTLVEFKKEDYPHLPFPLHQIERGGGLTFHHPGQVVFYPILKLNPTKLSLSSMIDEIFLQTQKVLEGWGVKDLTTENILLGLWHQNKKLASMGIAIEKLTTFHGMALNLFHDDKMESALRILNPCGISAETYTSIDKLVKLPYEALDTFADDFMKRIQNAWK